MAYMYKRNGKWRLMVSKSGVRNDIGLGSDLKRAKILKASIEQAHQDARFKKNLVDTLVSLGLINAHHAAASSENIVSWELAKQRLIEHLKNLGRAERTLYIYTHALNSVDKILNPQQPSDITPQKADLWVEKLLASQRRNTKFPSTLSKAAVNVMVRTVRSAFQKFLRWKFVSENPFLNCEMPKGEISLPRPLSDEELKKLLNASNKPLQRCIKVLVHSGMRPDEFYHLPWRRVILGSNPYIHIMKDGDWTPKAHTERRIPATAELIKSLGKPGLPEDLVAGKNEAFFPVNKNWLERSFRRAVKRAGLDGKKITVYCCRDTYATNLALQGYEAHAIAARLGHGNIETSMRYVSLARLNSEKIGK